MDTMRKVAVVGAGTMGHSLAQVFAQGGLEVALTDLRADALARASELISANLSAEAQAGLLQKGGEHRVMSRIHMTDRIEDACAGADIVIEAITENQAAKKDIFSMLDRLCIPRAILASNTSFMDIFKFVETKRPDKVLITHWFAPPHIVPLVEVVRGPQTSDETVAAVTALLDRIGKTSIVISRFLPGFIANRLQSALTNEMLFLIDHGYASAEQIDKAVKASFGFRMPVLGVAKKIDYSGVDQIQRSLGNGLYEPPPRRLNSEAMDRLVSEGRLGMKTGRGFFDYGGRSAAEILRETNIKLLKLREFLRGLGEL
ncbi:MAG: 3-hydroxyacyl-CoA dehydrogenase family protein [Burkholderiales bacterium]